MKSCVISTTGFLVSNDAPVSQRDLPGYNLKIIEPGSAFSTGADSTQWKGWTVCLKAKACPGHGKKISPE